MLAQLGQTCLPDLAVGVDLLVHLHLGGQVCAALDAVEVLRVVQLEVDTGLPRRNRLYFILFHFHINNCVFINVIIYENYSI